VIRGRSPGKPICGVSLLPGYGWGAEEEAGDDGGDDAGEQPEEAALVGAELGVARMDEG